MGIWFTKTAFSQPKKEKMKPTDSYDKGEKIRIT